MENIKIYYDKFEKIDEEKKQRIIQASLEVFGKDEYTAAHIDDIVSISKVSKGSLFNYFETKKKLYLYMFDYATNFLLDIFDNELILKEKDFFRRLVEIQKCELDLLDKYPYIIKFLELSLIAKDTEIQSTISTKMSYLLRISFEENFKDIDKSKFKEGVNISKVINLYSWTVTGFIKEYVYENNGILDYYALIEEYIIYLDMIRKGIYKEEYHDENINLLKEI